MPIQTKTKTSTMTGVVVMAAGAIGLAAGFVMLTSPSSSLNRVTTPIRILQPPALRAISIPRDPEIAVASLPQWTHLAEYSLQNVSASPISLSSITVNYSGTLGDAADIAKVSMAVGTAKTSSNIQEYVKTPEGWKMEITNPVTLEPNETAQVNVFVTFNEVVSGSSVDGVWNGVVRSGHQPKIRMVSYETLDAAGQKVSRAINAPESTFAVLRKNAPYIALNYLGTGLLVNGQQDLAKFRIGAFTDASPIAWKQLVFSYEKTSGVSLGNLRLRRGASEVDTNTYSIVDEQGKDLKSGIIDGKTGKGYIVVSFKQGFEETISGKAGVGYTLNGMVRGAIRGSKVALKAYGNPADPIITGYLSTSGYAAPFAAPSPSIYHVVKSTSETGMLSAFGDFVWSDLSEVPHTVSNPTSKDWTNGALVPGYNVPSYNASSAPWILSM